MLKVQCKNPHIVDHREVLNRAGRIFSEAVTDKFLPVSHGLEAESQDSRDCECMPDAEVQHSNAEATPAALHFS
jgi:hypothetical protein